MSDILNINLREPNGPRPKRPGLLQHIVDFFEDIGKTIKGVGIKYIKAKVAQESAKARKMKYDIEARKEELDLERQRLILQREKQQEELALSKKRDENAHKERMMELMFQQVKIENEAGKAVTERLTALKELGIKVNIQVTDLDTVEKNLLDSK